MGAFDPLKSVNSGREFIRGDSRYSWIACRRPLIYAKCDMKLQSSLLNMDSS
jgi:hypothetical protein